jgi:radical SAM superfamily enzyme YgiQ (UPF0313 family)
MKLLILFPNATNTPTISNTIPILAGIAKSKNWELDYFDTYIYKNEHDQEAAAGKVKMGGFKKGFELELEYKNPVNIVSDLQKKLDEFQPDLLAITCLSPEYDFLMHFFEQIKVSLRTTTIIGGVHATLTAEETAKTNLFDLVIIGEGEKTFTEILQNMEENKSLTSIEGTYFVDKVNKKVKKNPMRRLLPPEKLWEADRDFSFFNELYFLRSFDGKKVKRSDIEISRGCPYHCNYCATRTLKILNEGMGVFVKARPVDSCIKEMKTLVQNYGVDIFAFQDECFLSHPITWIKEFMDAYKQEINKPYSFMTRPETVSEKNIKMLVKYGIPFQISLGVESGSDRILLEVCDRTATRNKVIKAFDILNRYKIRTNTFFIVGFPFEKRKDTLKSIILCKRIKPSVASVSIYQPYPGQQLAKVCIENGFISKDAHAGTFASESLLNMPEPYLSNKEINNIWRVFMLYATLPKKYRKDIEKCEVDFDNNQDIYKNLMKIRWDEFDYSKIKCDIKLV